MRFPRFGKRNRLQEALNAYVDGALGADERAELEARLAADPSLRAQLEELRAVKRLVSSLEEVPAPRSFALDPSMVGAGAGRASLSGVSRFAFAAAGLGLIVAVFATFAMPAVQESVTSTALPAQGEGEIAGTTAPAAAAADAAAQEDAAPAGGAERALAPQAESGGAGGGAAASTSGAGAGLGKSSVPAETEDGAAASLADTGEPNELPWRLAQVLGVVAAAALGGLGVAIWWKGRTEVRS